MEQNAAHKAADTINELLEVVIENEEKFDVNEAMDVRDEVRNLGNRLQDGNTETGKSQHNLNIGDTGIDKHEPTPSTEANSVEVVELTNEPANEFTTDEGKLVSEYRHNRIYDSKSLVVGVVYPFMSGDNDVWYLPEDRIRAD